MPARRKYTNNFLYEHPRSGFSTIFSSRLGSNVAVFVLLAMFIRVQGDGCTITPCNNGGQCTPLTHPEYVCDCTGTGYHGVTCDIDDDECSGSHNCSVNAVCSNTPPGSYTCTCVAGYSGDGVTCTDDDECIGSNLCYLHAECRNTPGSYTCACKSGFSWDGDICSDVVTPLQIVGLSPVQGPVSGGTRLLITVTGPKNALWAPKIGFEPIPDFNWTSSVITLLTPAGKDTYQPYNVSLLLTDGSLINSAFTFTYKPDPEVTRVFPLKTIRSGGTRLTIEGWYLDSVAAPILELTIIPRGRTASRKRRQADSTYSLSSQCYKETITFNQTVCQTPNTTGYISDDESDLYELYIGLSLDGVHTYRNLSVVLPAYGRLNLHSDPTFIEWSEEKVVGPGNYLVVEGQAMNSGCSMDDYTVSIGESECKMVELLDNQLKCLPPDMSPTQTPNDQLLGRNRHFLLVQVGFTANHVVGVVSYKRTNTYIIIGIAVAVVVVIIATIVACVCLTQWFKRRPGRDDGAPNDQEMDNGLIPTRNGQAHHDTSYIGTGAATRRREVPGPTGKLRRTDASGLRGAPVSASSPMRGPHEHREETSLPSDSREPSLIRPTIRPTGHHRYGDRTWDDSTL